MPAFTFEDSQALPLEGGGQLPNLRLAYHIFGPWPKLPEGRLIWVCHALTANSDVLDWWAGLFGPDAAFDPARDTIICANNLGSCYGSSSPLSLNPATQKPYGSDFPLVSIRDMVAAHRRLYAQLQLGPIDVLIGGSQGGQQALEWAFQAPQELKNLIVLACNARHSPWGIAFNEAQRMALEAGPLGLQAARAIAMLSYRNYQMYQRTQTEVEYENLEGYGAASYQRYQGQKLAQRFDAQCYSVLSKAMDSHNLGRGRKGGISSVLAQISTPSLVIGISSDGLFPPEEQAFLASKLPYAELHILDSPYGHDGFLTETPTIVQKIKAFLNK